MITACMIAATREKSGFGTRALCVFLTALFFGGALTGCSNKALEHVFDGAELDSVTRIECGGKTTEDKETIAAVYNALNPFALTKQTVSLASEGAEVDSASMTVTYTKKGLFGTKSEKSFSIAWMEYKNVNLAGAETLTTKMSRKSGVSVYRAGGVTKEQFIGYFK